VNAWGYRLLAAKQFADAIGAFRINVTMYPKSSNVYDSLGEAYMNNGDRSLAIENYQRSLDLDSTNNNAVQMLKKLRSGG
jgi:Flp pilus assembly protein TadD